MSMQNGKGEEKILNKKKKNSDGTILLGRNGEYFFVLKDDMEKEEANVTFCA